MLRIEETTEQEGCRVVLKLEGRLVGRWVHELRRTAEATLDAAGHHLVLDLEGVQFADRPGATLLRSFRHQGAELINSSPFLDAQLDAADGSHEVG